MKTMPEKSSGAQPIVKEAEVFRSRSRVRKNGGLFLTRNFWRALSSASFASPQTPTLRRLHD
jgi:hypothetical protein